MPASTRKSSLGNLRRGPQKYIPYRADDFQHGKKTGIAVGYVDRMSDEFEPFDKVISQADNRTPFRPQVARKRRGPKTPVVVHEEPEEDDEYGEKSMELEDSIPNSPSAYFAHTRMKAITSSVQRVGSSSRPVQHTSDVDFDELPSPRASPSYTARKSLPHSSSVYPSVRSRLSHSTVAQEDEGDDYSDGIDPPDFGGYDDTMDDGEDYPQEGLQTFRHGRTPRRTSFAQMDQDAEEEAHVEQEMDFGRSPSAKARGKQRADHVSPPPVPDDDMEPEISRGLQNIELEPINEGDIEPPIRTIRQEMGREVAIKNKERAKPREKTRTRKNVILRELTPDDPNTDGVRRSKRMRYSPLDWWRLEKVVYGRRESGTSLVPSIKEIHRIPQIKPEPLGAKKRKGGQRKKSRTAEPEAQQIIVYDPEDGWDDETDPYCNVLDYGEDGKESTRRIAFTAKMLTPKAAAQGAFYFQKIFGDGDFLAAGQLIIPPHSTKPTKGTKDNTFVFYVIQGAIKFAVHQSNFILATGGMFMVPRGNVYYITNICERDAKLFFAQARNMPGDIRDIADEHISDTEGRARSRSTGVALRRESMGRASSDTVNGEEPQPKSKSRRGTSTR
ncbi:Mif2/CENP-C like-domain-containing protein [Trametes gibbosa]|nr:Mif2/CENP-C like-domain-containing protein [Trametes gibbosa]